MLICLSLDVAFGLVPSCRFRFIVFFFSSRRRHTSWPRDWSSDVCSFRSLAGCETVMGSNEKFDWKATESAPHNYPIEIISGTFFYHGDSNSAGLYVPSGALIHEKGWGEKIGRASCRERVEVWGGARR